MILGSKGLRRQTYRKRSRKRAHTNTQRRLLFAQETCRARVSKRDAAAETDDRWRGDRMRVKERYRTLGRQRPKDEVKRGKIKIKMRKKTVVLRDMSCFSFFLICRPCNTKIHRNRGGVLSFSWCQGQDDTMQNNFFYNLWFFK